MCGGAFLSWAAVNCRVVALRGQQRGLEGAGSIALTRSEHLTGEMVKGVVSFWGERVHQEEHEGKNNNKVQLVNNQFNSNTLEKGCSKCGLGAICGFLNEWLQI
ncbi:hypothetical protein ILYODFUR_034574 [Ilyodon furcidens]|uniref:Uncharacterized protein n=1 Tax=Ilyodon furcidens TaxID=33524 RepID=A0ABV0ST00_9TELE